MLKPGMIVTNPIGRKGCVMRRNDAEFPALGKIECYDVRWFFDDKAPDGNYGSHIDKSFPRVYLKHENLFVFKVAKLFGKRNVVLE